MKVSIAEGGGDSTGFLVVVFVIPLATAEAGVAERSKTATAAVQ